MRVLNEKGSWTCGECEAGGTKHEFHHPIEYYANGVTEESSKCGLCKGEIPAGSFIAFVVLENKRYGGWANYSFCEKCHRTYEYEMDRANPSMGIFVTIGRAMHNTSIFVNSGLGVR